eukprot:1112563-Karenia_brevis.AAC.1
MGAPPVYLTATGKTLPGDKDKSHLAPPAAWEAAAAAAAAGAGKDTSGDKHYDLFGTASHEDQQQ